MGLKTLVLIAGPQVLDGPKIGLTDWGTISDYVQCPGRIKGFKLRVEAEIDGDNSALNGIQLICQDGSTSRQIEGHYGVWSNATECSGDGYITDVDVRGTVGRGYGLGPGKDDYGATNVRVKCSGGDEQVGDGIAVGDFAGYGKCPVVTYLCY